MSVCSRSPADECRATSPDWAAALPDLALRAPASKGSVHGPGSAFGLVAAELAGPLRATRVPHLLLGLLRAMPSRLGKAASRLTSLGGRPTSKAAGRHRDLLPLPFAQLRDSEVAALAKGARDISKAIKQWIYVMIICMNHMYSNCAADSAEKTPVGPPTVAQLAAIQHLGSAAATFLHTSPSVLEPVAWAEELAKKRVAYDGEEVGTAESLTLEQVAPGLPPAGVAGKLCAASLCTGNVRRCILDLDGQVLPEERWPEKVPKAKIWASAAVWESLVALLWSLGLVTPIRLQDVFHVRGEPVLCGGFGVRKGPEKTVEMPGGILACALRLIMNLVPSNTYQWPIGADMDQLPLGVQWTSIVLLAYELLLWTSADRKCFFYVFRLPDGWQKYMTFARPVHGRCVGQPGQSKVYVASTTVAMGWISATGVCQHIHRNMLRPQFSLSAGLPHEGEWRRDRPAPLTAFDSRAWEVYIDNLEMQEVLPRDEALALKGSISGDLARSRAAYAAFGSPGADDKDCLRQLEWTALGERINGELGRKEPPLGYVLRVISLTWWLLAQQSVMLKHVQICLGRWVRVFGHNRAGFGCLERTWSWMTRCRRHRVVPATIADELLLCCGLGPLAFTNFRVRISPDVSASDASPSGGAVCISRGLTPAGEAAVEKAGRQPWHKSEEEVILMSLFDGIGGTFEAWHRLGLQMACGACSEIDQVASRVRAAAWPTVAELGDITRIDEAMLRRGFE